MYKQSPKQNKNNADLMRYAGFGMQLFISLGIAVFAGIKADQWLGFTIPVFAWVLPLIVLCLMMYKMIRQTSGNKQPDDE